MKKARLNLVSVSVSLFGFLAAAGNPLYPCSTFVLRSGSTLLVGHNLDERSDVPGLVFINKCRVAKASVSWAALISGCGGTMESLIERFAAYPERSRCDK